MKAYVVTTGVIFGLLVGLHIWRALWAEPHLAKDPGYIVITLTAAVLCLWAVRLVWGSRKS